MYFSEFKAFIQQTVFGFHLYQMFSAFLLVAVTLIFRKFINQYIIRLLVKLSRRTKTEYDDLLIEALKSPLNILILISGLYFAVQILVINVSVGEYRISEIAGKTFHVILSVIVLWTIYRLSNFLAVIVRNLISRADAEMARQFAPLITQALRITVLIIGTILIIQNLGYSVGSLLAGLGIGGLAIALAAKDTLANLFGTLVMIADRPFKVGDWVQFSNIDGNVESIGFRSTKVRTWSKSLKIVPNKLLTSEIIENWSAMPKRRVKMTIGITYDSPPEKIIALRDGIEDILKKHPGVNQDYFLVYFTGFGPSELEFFIYYFTSSTVWKEYLETRQNVNIRIIELVNSLGLSFAFPSQSLYFNTPLELDSEAWSNINGLSE